MCVCNQFVINKFDLLYSLRAITGYKVDDSGRKGTIGGIGLSLSEGNEPWVLVLQIRISRGN